MTREDYFIGIDVGTGSVRAALVNKSGEILKVSVHPIVTWNPKAKFYEQSSQDIWQACCTVVKDVLKDVDTEQVKGIGFDATCSLVVLDKEKKPLTVSITGKNEQNIILWMDHRAEEEAAFINTTKHSVLQYVGGKISLEMEIPKLMWLKKHLKTECWDKAGIFFDLPDFLTWKATGSESRSLCSLVCKWTYCVQSDGTDGWNESLFEEIGLSELLEDGAQRIGREVMAPGSQCGAGLTPEAAQDLGLLPGTAVATSIIDAHAGGLGMLGCSVHSAATDFHSRLGLICGTSTCHMAVSLTPLFCEGVWGPYYSAMVPGMWLNEAGQSATGRLIDHIIETHPATQHILDNLSAGMHIQDYLKIKLMKLAEERSMSHVAFLTKDLHIWPDFHGNRSPLADPTLKGMIMGLTLAVDEENLALLYLATLQALAYGTRHIVDQLERSGHCDLQVIVVCGGLSRSALFVQALADVLQRPVLVPHASDPVLLGAAMLAAAASRAFPNVHQAVYGMAGEASIVHPTEDTTLLTFHQNKYRVFLNMLQLQTQSREIMNSS